MARQDLFEFSHCKSILAIEVVLFMLLLSFLNALYKRISIKTTVFLSVTKPQHVSKDLCSHYTMFLIERINCFLGRGEPQLSSKNPLEPKGILSRIDISRRIELDESNASCILNEEEGQMEVRGKSLLLCNLCIFCLIHSFYFFLPQL